MRKLTDLPAWDRLFRKIVWAQRGEIRGRRGLDFGSGEGITADHYAADNDVTAVEPWDEMLKDAWRDHEYRQIVGGVEALTEFADDTFDVIICHNVLEYADDKPAIVRELARVLKPGGFLSLVKHNRYGRVMQMAVLRDDFDKANSLLGGEDSAASKFGRIRYYDDADIQNWCPELVIEKTCGIRAFWDLQQNQEKHPDEHWQEEMMKLEMRAAEIKEFRDIAFFHHLILRKAI